VVGETPALWAMSRMLGLCRAVIDNLALEGKLVSSGVYQPGFRVEFSQDTSNLIYFRPLHFCLRLNQRSHDPGSGLTSTVSGSSKFSMSLAAIMM
jgi:hypothetical protein